MESFRDRGLTDEPRPRASDAAPDRRGARQVYRRTGEGETRGRDRAAQPVSAGQCARGSARRDHAEEHLDDRSDRRRQDRDRAPLGGAGRCAIRQSRGDEVHRGRLRRTRRRVDGSRSRRGLDPHRYQRAPRRSRRARRASGRRARDRRASSRDAPAIGARNGNPLGAALGSIFGSGYAGAAAAARRTVAGRLAPKHSACASRRAARSSAASTTYGWSRSKSKRRRACRSA